MRSCKGLASVVDAPFGAGRFHPRALECPRGPARHPPFDERGAMKIKLNLDAVSVESFETSTEAREVRGTVRAHAVPTEQCNSRNPFCLTPTPYRPCITDEVECG